jgi:hypothetical protein
LRRASARFLLASRSSCLSSALKLMLKFADLEDLDADLLEVGALC